jgi:hypothetical protein
MTRAFPKRRMLLAVLALAGSSVPGRAEERCPWLSSATASGVLGGDVTTSVTHSNKNKEDATCEFVRRSQSSDYTLRIEVSTMTNPHDELPSFLARCGSNREVLRGIGNEAIACTSGNRNEKPGERVISRVRERALVVQVSSNDKSATHQSRAEQARTVAEQVSGNLF